LVTDATHKLNIFRHSTDQEFMELTMSLLHRTNVYQGANEKAVRKHPEYGFVLALIVMALALVAAKYSHQHPLVWFGP
jgi:hypothetical protein